MIKMEIFENCNKKMYLKICVFNENVLVWIGGNYMKIVGVKLVCFILVEMKTDIFKNILVY